MEDIRDKERYIDTLPKQKKGFKAKIVQAVVLLLLILVIACGCFIFGMIYQNNHSQEESVPAINSVQIVQEVQAIGELATVKYIYTDMGKFEDSQQFKGYDIPLTTKSFILSWNGTIKAGVDTENIQIDIDEATKTIVVRVPEPRILSHETDENSIEIFDETNNIFNPISIDDYSTFFAESKTDMESKALNNGILDEALQNAQNIITQCLNSNENIKDMYTIEFELLTL